MILNPKGDSFDIYVNADFSGNWNPDEASEHSYTVAWASNYLQQKPKQLLILQSFIQNYKSSWFFAITHLKYVL